MYTAHNLPDAAQHRAYGKVFSEGLMTLGVMCPIESYAGDTPTMKHHAALAKAAETAGFSALWLRDVPLRDPSFGDVGQTFETFSYLGFLAGQTSSIALATAAVILPLRHPLHTAKAAATIDQLTNGRFILGVASGDRAREFPAFGKEAGERGHEFREAVYVMQDAWAKEFPTIESGWGTMHGLDLVPKPTTRTVPLVVTGRSQQDLRWIAQHADGWMSYPRSLRAQTEVVAGWRAISAEVNPDKFLPFAQSLYIDLSAQKDEMPTPIHLGWRLGRRALRDLLQDLAAIGVNHVALNLKYGKRPAADVLDEIAQFVLPYLPTTSMQGSSS